ncbi:tetratricopeptide (TPR) repeat protein [Saccharothrix tamanrassetensis]|uniref:Tetratricopeptide (TPR) repeat protein n=1 Tax=Saccharothrix tamanrassetensis TaxID=1051531 RepID=A0A841CPK5_9PSEU|nr:hypothetical protein [Saccharothrix tamanrassetensis]MBB5958007.1 tetratricopeptide (TPR) repeat protein [Saccharothrix tamanrassetensis]
MRRWRKLNDEGVRLLQAGDVAGGRAALERAYRKAFGEDRASILVNLAAAADLAGDRVRAADLLTEALRLTGEASRAVVLASRADVLLGLERWDEAWQDVERGLVDAPPHAEAMLRNVRTGLLMVAGRLAEAEAEALATVELATRAAPDFVVHAYTNLAAIAEASGDADRAATYRRLVERPAGVRPIDPRWHESVNFNSQGAMLAASGDVASAASAFEAAYRATLGSDDTEALVCRAAVAGNLAGLAGLLGDGAEALRWNTEAVTLARAVIARVGDEYGTVDVLTSALIARAENLRHAARHAEALADLDDAVALAGSQPSIVAVRASVLAACGRFGEAAAEAHTALDLAYGSAPQLAAFVHTTLAEVAGATGDPAGSAEHLGLARDLAAATGDVGAQATAVLSLARLAYLDSANDRAAALYDEAENLVRATGNRRGLVVCLLGRAAVEVGSGRPREALALLDRAVEGLGDGATPVERIAIHQVQGAALETLEEYAAADERYDAAAGIGERAGLWHVVLGVAWWRADALIRWASTVDGDRRRELCERALDLALPAALAAEAVRQRFGHGPLRERWVALAAAPAIRSAFAAVSSLGDVELAAAYIDHIAGTVSLSPAEEQPLARGELVSLPPPPAAAEEEHLPYAASFVGGAGDDPAFPPVGFALPPRVRVDPALPSTLDGWIDIAERRYGFPVRSERAVASW